MRAPLELRLVLLTAAIALAASCKRETAKPSRVLPTVSLPMPAVASTAAAEVAASSGPLRVTFRLLKDKIRLGEPLEVGVTLTNIGRERILITDAAFLGPAKRLEDRGHLKEPPYGLSVEVTDARGKRVPVKTPLLPGDTTLILPRSHTPAESQDLADANKRVKEWQAEGLSDTQIKLKLFELSQEQASVRFHPPKPLWLKPDQSISLPPWRAPDDDRWPGPVPAGFTDLPYYAFPRPGKYRILLRALYGPTPWLRQEFPELHGDPEDVNVVPVPIEFEVLP